jgi:hypothetical protein
LELYPREALRHIREIVGMVVAELVEEGEDFPLTSPCAERFLVSLDRCVWSG